MTQSAPTAAPTFQEVAKRVQQRLLIRKSLEALLSTWRPAAAGLTLLLILRLAGFWHVTWPVIFLFTAGWILGCVGITVWRRAGEFEALAYWDKLAARQEAFANAWWFEQQPAEKRTRAQDLHIEKQHEKLAEAVQSLQKDIPFPDVRQLAFLPLGALVFLLTPGGNEAPLSDPKLSDEARLVAKQEGQKLGEGKLDDEKMGALTPEEKAELEKLQAKVQETAKTLEQERAKTAREVLGDLESRAREAERLAKKLGAGDDAWASEQMVAEMRKHADTAAMGDAVSSKATEMTASEAQAVADKLKSSDLVAETRDRFAQTLRAIGKQAQPEDKDRTVGQHVIAADKDMAQALVADASREFQALADKMRGLAAREKAREELEKLAQQLREAGSNVAGEGTKGMQQLGGGQNGQGPQGQQGMKNLANAPQTPPMQPPGMGNSMQMAPGQKGQGGNSQSLPMMTPAPKDGSKGGKSMALVPGDGKKGSNKPDQPMLFAPIPGGDPDQPPDAVILGMVPGVSSAGANPGDGTSELGNNPTEKSKAGREATASAQQNADGRSTVRSIEGQARTEQAARGSQTTAIEAIAAEEAALDDQALPSARREQVRRYFTELRKRFENEP